MRYLAQLVKKYVPYETQGWQSLNFWLITAISLTIPFSLRYVIESPGNYATGAYSDFTSYSVYLSDFLLFGYVLINFRRFNQALYPVYGLITWLLLQISIIQGNYAHLELYFATRLLILILVAFLVAQFHFSSKYRIILASFAILAGVIQSIIALIQFYTQKSIGLYLLGESHLSPDYYGVAKIVAHGTKLIRGYGTFPHSNLLSAFLLITTLLNLYLLTKNYQFYIKLILSLSFLVNFIGIFVSMSRGGISALIICLFIFHLLLLFNRKYELFKKIAILSTICLTISVLIFYPYLNTRTTISDSAVKERLFYNKIGISIIKNNWLFGTGPGTSVLHMEHYSPIKLESWEIQPIHNYYLLTFAEWGIGSLFLLYLIMQPILVSFRNTIKKIKNTDIQDWWNIILSIIGISFLYLFFFDHYFYTIWPTQILLWLFIGLIMANNKAETQQ